MSEGWFSEKIAPDGDVEDGCHPHEAEALKEYLRQKTTVNEAARAITQPIANADNPREDLPRLWAFIGDALLELPSEHTDSLIALLQAIENLPEPDFTTIEEKKRPGEKLWKGLPGFGHLWSDSYQSGSWRKNAKTTNGPEREALRSTHVRKAESEARLVAAGLAGIPIDWGYEVIADALESTNALLDFEVPAAAQWLILCGSAFRQGAQQNRKSWALKPHITSSSNAPSRYLWRAPSDEVMNLERWAFWEERLRELQAEEGSVGDAAKMAYEAIHKVNISSSS
ncbi:hypothetical protein N0V90_001594 [Kalmusia sp. IMI 367209]|nr:hypothetical protein N0V90_001594 [Kalmusia sp. IMI 367209]